MQTEALIVVAEDDAAATETREVIAGWARARLLRDVYWVSATRAQAQASASEVVATIVGPDGEREVNLVSDLARRRLSCIKLLTLALEDQVGEIEDVVTVATTIYHEFLDSVPIPLDRLALIVPVTGASSVGDLSVARPGWSVVVASAEDRPSSRFVAKPVARDDNLAGHAALLLTIVGSRWHGMRSGPLEGPDESGSGGAANLRVGRAYGRVVFGDAVLDDVVDATLSTRELWPRPIVGESPMPEASDNSLVVGRMADDLMAVDDGALRYHPYQAPPSEPVRMVTPLEALREFARFMIGRFLRLPEELWARVKGEMTNRIETFVQNLTYGQNSQVLVRLGPGHTAVVVAEDLGTDAARLLDIAGQAATELTEARPDVWRSVRQSAVGLLDGSPMPNGVRPPAVGEGPRIVASDPAIAAPDAEDDFVLGDDVNQRLELPDGELPSRVAFLDAFVAQRVCTRVGEIVEERRALAEALANPPGGAVVPPVDPVLEHAERLLDELNEWEARRSPSLLWEVAGRTGTELDGARKDLESSLGILGAGVPSPDLDALGKALHKMTIRNYIAASFMAIGVAIGVALGIFGPIGWALAAVIIVACVLLGSGVGFLAFWRFKREEFQLLHRPRQLLTEYWNAAERLIQATREVVRLTSHYQQLQIWGEVVARISRRPWMPTASTKALDLDQIVTPLALQISRGSTSPAQRDGLIGVATRQVFKVGWLLECYEQVAAQADADYCRHFALAVAPPPEMDRPAQRIETMDGIVELLRTEAVGRKIFDQRRAQVVHRLAQLQPTQVFDTCAPIGSIQGYGEISETTDAREFLQEGVANPAGVPHFRGSTFTSAAATRDLHRVDSSTVWRPIGFALPTTPDVEQALEHGDDEAGDDSLNAVVLRFEASTVLQLEDLALYGADAAVDEPERAYRPDANPGTD